MRECKGRKKKEKDGKNVKSGGRKWREGKRKEERKIYTDVIRKTERRKTGTNRTNTGTCKKNLHENKYKNTDINKKVRCKKAHRI